MKSTHQIRPSWHCARQMRLVPYSSVLVYTLLLSCKTFLGVGVFFSENSETSWGQRPCIGFFFISSQQGMGPLLLICTAPACARTQQAPVLKLIFQDHRDELICLYSLAWSLLWDKWERLLAGKVVKAAEQNSHLSVSRGYGDSGSYLINSQQAWTMPRTHHFVYFI